MSATGSSSDKPESVPEAQKEEQKESVPADFNICASSGKYVPQFTVLFEEETIPPQGNLEPPQGLRRVFWMMKTLETSMLQGAHIADGLYIPKGVWFQTGAKLMGQQAKIAFCTGMAEALRELKKVDIANAKSVVAALDAFLVRAEREREALHKQLPMAAKSEAMMANSAANSNKLFSGKMFKNIYKSAIGLVAGNKKEIFDGIVFVDKWVTHFEESQNKEVLDRIEKMSNFFLVVCLSFVMQDLTLLLERYMKKSRESFSRLFPKKKNK